MIEELETEEPMTEEQFENKLTRDLSWRKKEFSNLELLIQQKHENASTSETDTLYRAAILLLYSHWEGHIKYCAQLYIKYICSLDHKCIELKDNFHQIMLGKHLSKEKISQLNGSNVHHQKMLFDFFKDQTQQTFKVNEDSTISTRSNLNFEQLSIIFLQLGFELGDLDTKKAFIDEKLLEGRNAIAHGNRRGKEELESLYNEIKSHLLRMIEHFHDLTRNSISNKTYLKPAVESS